MHRLTARLLFILFVASTCTPVLQALSADPPHACCLRHVHKSSGSDPRLHDSTTHQGNCCPPMTTTHSASLSSIASSIHLPHASEFAPTLVNLHRTTSSNANNSSRAPPALS
jgi:hypothetical protein